MLGRRQQIALIISTALAAMPAVAVAGTYTWNGGDSTFGTMTTADDWLGGSSPYSAAGGTADLAFGFLNPHGFSPTLSGNLDVNSLTFNSVSLAYTVATNGSGFSGILSLEGGGLNDVSGNAQVITGATAVSLNASQPWNVSGAALTDRTPVNLNTSVLTLNASVASGSATFSGALSGSGAAGLTKIGPGSLVLSGSGTIPALLLQGGATQVSSGTYTLTSTSTPFDLNAATLNVSGGAVIDWSATSTFAAIDGASGTAGIVTGSNSKLKAGFQFDVGGSAQGLLTVTNGGSASGTGYFIVGDGAGSTGVLNISGGTVTAAEGIVGNFSGANGNATVTGNGSQWTVSNYLGVGGNAQTGAATGLLTISNNGAVTAPITTLYYGNSTININGGTLTTGGISSFQTGNGSIALTNPAGGYALNLNGSSQTYNYSGGITGTGTLNKSGGSTQILSGTLNNSALFQVNSGTLIFNGSGGSSIGELTVQGGAVNVSAGSLTVLAAGLNVTGGVLTVNGTAKLIASGFNGINGSAGTNLTISGSTADYSNIGGGLNVGSGHTGTFNVLLGAQASTGQLIVPLAGSGILSIASGGIVSSTSALLADSTTSGSTGTATITGPNSAWNISGGLTLGAAGNTGSLNINASGGVHVTGVTTFALSIPVNISGGAFTTGGLSSTGAYGLINLTADPAGGSALTINGSMGTNTYSGAIYGAASIQKSGGSTQVLSGQIITTGNASVTAGTLSFNGNESDSLQGLSIQGGAANVSSGSLTLTGSAASLAITGGTLNVNGGDVFNPVLGDTTVDGTGSILNVNSGGQLSSGALDLASVNNFSSVSLNISSGGLVNATSLAVAAAPSTSATALVTGTGSTLKVSGALTLGNTFGNGQDAMGSLSITGGGNVSAAYCSFQQAAASVTINGGFLSTGYLTSQDTGDGSINLTDPAGGTALTINDATATDINTYSGTITGTGSFQKSGGSTQILSGNINTSGSATVMAGTLVFSGTGDSSLGGLSVQGGAANISAGVLKLSSVGSGLDVTAGTLTVGTNATLDTTAAANNDFISGPAGATLNVIGSGAVYKSGGTLLIGYSAGTTGTLNVSQSGQVSAGTLSISNMGTAVLNISSGGIVNCGEADLGSLLTSGYIATATVSGAGSALNAASLYIGQSSATGNLNINTGGGVYVSTITDIFAMGSINISGGTFSTGELQSNSALIDLIADPIGGTALTINDSTASDHSTYFGTITGAGSLLKTGASTQILSGTNSFTGTVTVNGGTLNMSNAAASSYTVNSGKLIVNTGNVTGPVYVEGGGLLSGQGNYSSVQLLAGSTFLPGAYNGTFGTMTGTTALIQPAASGVTFSHTSITLSAPTAITVNNSTDTLELTSPLTTNNSAITKTGNGSVFLMPFNTSSLTISAGTVSLDTAVGQTPLHLQTLSISGAGTLDLENGSADITTTPLATINPLVKSGYLNGNWNGSGIASLSAQNDSTHLTAIGAIQNNQSGMAIYNSSNKFNGTVPGAGDVLLAYTYYGDANLDGKVDGSDYSRIDAAFLADKTNPTAATGWFNGDFNYDGSVNGSDYTLIDNAFNTQGARLSAQLALPTAQIAGSNQVPEPSISLIALGTIALLARRRGRS